jgi:hypothetical protein
MSFLYFVGLLVVDRSCISATSVSTLLLPRYSQFDVLL